MATTTDRLLLDLTRIVEYLVSCRRWETSGEAAVEATSHLNDLRSLRGAIADLIAEKEKGAAQ